MNLRLLFLGVALLVATSVAQSSQPRSGRPELFDYDHEVAVGDDAFNSGSYADSEQHYRNAAIIAEQLHMEPDRIAAPWAGVAHSLLLQKKYAEAEPIFRRVLASREKHPPAEIWRLKQTLEGLAESLFKQNRPDEAEPYDLRALALYDRPTDYPDPDGDSCRHGHTLLQLGWIYFQRRDFEKSEVMDQRALTVWTQSKQKCAIIAAAMDQLAILYKAQGKLDKAEEMYQHALPMLQTELVEQEPELVAKQFDGLAGIYQAEGKDAQAADSYAQALGIVQVIKPQPEQTLMTTLQSYWQVLYKLKRTEEAQKIQSQIDAINQWKADASTDPSTQLDGLLQLASKSELAHNLPEEAQYLQRATQVADKLTIRRDFRIGESYRRLAVVYQWQNKLPEAEAAMSLALSADEVAFGKDSEQITRSLRGLANLNYRQRNFDAAEALFKRELAIEEKSPVLNSGAQATILDSLGNVYFNTRKYDKAEAVYEREIRLLEAGTDNLRLITASGELAATYEAERKYDRAEAMYLRTLSLQEKQFGPENPMLQGPLWSLKELMVKLNRPTEAAQFEARRQHIEQLLLQKNSANSVPH